MFVRGRGRGFKAGQFNGAAYMQWEPRVTDFGGYYAYNVGEDGSQYPDPSWAGLEGIGIRHGKGAAILGIDARVHWISIRSFDAEASNPGRGLLWCVPDSPNGR
jgi:hypothetical protein